MLTDKEITEALAVCEAATPGPWELECDIEAHGQVPESIAAARTLLPRALMELQEARAKAEKMSSHISNINAIFDEEVARLQSIPPRGCTRETAATGDLWSWALDDAWLPTCGSPASGARRW